MGLNEGSWDVLLTESNIGNKIYFFPTAVALFMGLLSVEG